MVLRLLCQARSLAGHFVNRSCKKSKYLGASTRLHGRGRSFQQRSQNGNQKLLGTVTYSSPGGTQVLETQVLESRVASSVACSGVAIISVNIQGHMANLVH